MSNYRIKPPAFGRMLADGETTSWRPSGLAESRPALQLMQGR